MTGNPGNGFPLFPSAANPPATTLKGVLRYSLQPCAEAHLCAVRGTEVPPQLILRLHMIRRVEISYHNVKCRVAQMAKLSVRLLLAAACALVAATPLAFAQEPGICPDAGGLFAAYDVVSVKPVHPDRITSIGVTHHPDGIDGESVTVEMLVRSSYSYTFGTGPWAFVNEDVISGLPDWAKNDYFSLQAKIGPEQLAVFGRLDPGQQRACQDNMEQAMLTDSFKLKMHRQPRQVPVYDLVVAKGGSKLKESTGPDPNVPIGPDGKPQTMTFAPRQSRNAMEFVMQAYSISMLELANLLTISNVMGVNHTVLDKTGLTGRYSFTLTFTPSRVMGPAGWPTVATASDSGSSISNALEDQLGLRLQRTTMAFDTVVVDHVERPGPN